MLENHLKKHFGFDSFKSGQKEVIQKLLDRQSAIAIFPTGAGKSLCYQLPAMILPKMTLVVSPLLSLMKDQAEFLLKHNIPTARLDSTIDKNDYAAIFERAKNGTLKVLMISVERFKNERFRYHLQKMDISLLVIDEAHCISEWGHNFRPEYLKLPSYQRAFDIPQVLLLTATATQEVVDDMRDKFRIPSENVIVTGFYRENLFLQITPVSTPDKKNKLLGRIKESPHISTIIYVTLQKTAEELAENLRENQIKAHYYHAGMKNDEREEIQNQFMDGRLTCIVATIAFGMGIDKKDIRRIIHYDLPKSIENYSQEIGRSGRDGETAFCEVFANGDNRTVLENFVYGDTPEKHSIAQLLQKIQQNDGPAWEMKVAALSNELNIRLLPLKTMLVYLDIEGIIRPRVTYFEKYSFRYNVEPSHIINRFQNERKTFVTTILNHCHTKKIWTSVDMHAILSTHTVDRRRIIAALEYFDEKGWIELQAGTAVDVYDILAPTFGKEEVSEKLYTLFKRKEEHEIHRIHNMIQFFESNSCLSRRLAGYFGENIKKENCGHCSYCLNGGTAIHYSSNQQVLSDMDFDHLTKECITRMGENCTETNITKFLCGIYVPHFTKLKMKNLSQFGALEKYPFQEVEEWVRTRMHPRFASPF
jgi:ATP-dependent DNA helicase RecQ